MTLCVCVLARLGGFMLRNRSSQISRDHFPPLPVCGSGARPPIWPGLAQPLMRCICGRVASSGGPARAGGPASMLAHCPSRPAVQAAGMAPAPPHGSAPPRVSSQAGPGAPGLSNPREKGKVALRLLWSLGNPTRPSSPCSIGHPGQSNSVGGGEGTAASWACNLTRRPGQLQDELGPCRGCRAPSLPVPGWRQGSS